MGLVNPRPAMRKGEERRVRKNLDLHAKRMGELVAGGMDATAASKQTFDELFRKPKAAPAEKPVYYICSCTICSWQGSPHSEGHEQTLPQVQGRKGLPQQPESQ